MLTIILESLYQLASLKIIAMMFLGSLLGMLVGFLPGLSGTVALAVLIPFVFDMPLMVYPL